MPAPQSFWVKVTRPRDLLEITFAFRDVDVTPPQGGLSAKIGGLPNSTLAVYFQSQHMAEEAIYETNAGFEPTQDEKDKNPDWPDKYQVPPGNGLPGPGNIDAIFSGPSRLVFNIPQGQTIDYTLEGLLRALQELPLVVSPLMTYKPPGCNPFFPFTPSAPPPTIVRPGENITAIEAPYRLILSPEQDARWEHATQPVEHLNRTELWHTRLLTGQSDDDLLMRAIWSPDFQANNLQDHSNEPFRMSLDGRDRNELVHLTSNWHLPNYQPEPVDADQLMLSTLGAWLKVYGDWPVINEIEIPDSDGQLLTVEQWRHEATMARDQFVRVVYAGYLYPFGHRASLVKITERKFYYSPDPPGYVAYLFQRMFIIVRQRQVSYGHRQLPFKRVIVKTRVTPNLDPPEQTEAYQNASQEAFWPRVSLPTGKSYFPFEMMAEDLEGRMVEFTAPVIFVTLNAEATRLSDVKTEYNTTTSETDGRRQRPFNGQPVAYASPTQPNLGDTTLSTDSFSFEGQDKSGPSPNFRPDLTFAEVDIPAVARMLGTSKSYEIAFEDKYLNPDPGQGPMGNKGDVFVKLRDEAALNFQVDKGGGLVAPDITITGLSRSLGPVDTRSHTFKDASNQDVTVNLIDGGFAVEKIFDGVELLGGITLGDIIRNVDDFGHAFSAGPKIPAFKDVVEKINGVDTARTTYVYELDASGLRNTELFSTENNTAFTISSTVETPLNGDPGKFTLEGKLTNFNVLLLPGVDFELVEIQFKEIKFVAINDKKPDVSVDLKGVEFKGILAFVNTISDIIPLDGFQDPPSLEITPSGIEVGYSLGIPAVAVGIFSLQNISLSAGVFLPLLTDKKLNFHFAFCERHQPFLLTVSIFGGGGFFGMDIGIDGVVLIEASLEFGVAAAINLGVASGSASMMGGVYFQKAGSEFELTGYFQAKGSLSVLGIITVSLEFYLGLTYSSKGSGGAHAGAMWGQAKLTVKIEILFFSTSVSVSMEREFGGSDPIFHQLVAPSDWALYCNAFATI